MSEILSECELHPSEDTTFRRSVLRCLIAKNLIHKPQESDKFTQEFCGKLGADFVFSTLVNECANRIDTGECNKFEVNKQGLFVEINARSKT